MNLVVVESPLAGDVRENLRYALWCCRQEYLADARPIASHLVCPWFMADTDATERQDGIDWQWVWRPDVPHAFYVDRGFSRGMGFARQRCERDGISYSVTGLRGACRVQWYAGAWPPHTAGFQVAPEMSEDTEAGTPIGTAGCPCCGADLEIVHGDEHGTIGVYGSRNSEADNYGARRRHHKKGQR